MKIGIVTDTHLAAPDRAPGGFHNAYDFANAREHFQRALARLTDADVDAIAMLGDLANNGDEPHHRLGLELLGKAGLPVWIVSGNHDCEEGVNRLAERVSAAGNSVRIPSPTGEHLDDQRLAGLPSVHFGADWTWRIAEPETASWGDDPVLLLSHAPVISRKEASVAAGLKYAGDAGNHERVASILRARTHPTVVVHGHLHLRDAVIDGAILQIGCASIIEPPHETAVLDIDIRADEVIVKVRHEAVAPSTVEQLPILAPAASAWRFAFGQWMPQSGNDR